MPLKIKVSVTDTKDKSMVNLERFARTGNSYVTIGIHSGAGNYQDGVDVVQVALWNEFGTKDIPARSFLRSVIDSSIFEDIVNRWRQEAFEHIINDGWTVEKALEQIGFKVQVLVQNKIKSNVPPANKPATVQAKKREGVPNRTLMETKLLLRSVTYKVSV